MHHLHATYMPVPTGSGFKCVPMHHGHMMWRSNMVGQPMLPMEMGGGIDWGKVWEKAKEFGESKVLPAVEKHYPAVGAKLIELGMKKLGLGVEGDDVFAEAGSAMRSRRRGAR